MTTRHDDARVSLRLRQGAGARYDDAAAPHEALDLARRGTAYFARMLNNLSDDELNGQCKRSGRNRRWIIGAIGLQARVLADSVSIARLDQGVEVPFQLQVDTAEVELAATLPSQALRNLFMHSEVHLNVEWRDLAGAGWQRTVHDRTGRSLAIRSTPFIRAASLWQCALELNAGARATQIPDQVKGWGQLEGASLRLI